MKIFNKKFLGILISIFFIILIINQIDIKKSFEAIKHVSILNFIWIIPLYCTDYMIRAYRWRIILSNNPLLKLRSLISSMIIGFMANSLLPARVGEIYRAHIFGKKENIKRLKVFASIVLERIFDGTVLFSILIILICYVYPRPWLFKLAAFVGTIFVGGFIFLMIFSKSVKLNQFQNNILLKLTKKFFDKYLSKFPQIIQKIIIFYIIDKIKYFLDSFTEGLDLFNYPKLIFKVFFLSFLVWLLEGTIVFIVITGFGIHIGILSALFVLCVTAFSTMIPSGPASIGPYQWGYIMALGLLGVNRETAFAVSIINQLVGVSFVSVTGLFFIFKDHINIKNLEKEEFPCHCEEELQSNP